MDQTSAGAYVDAARWRLSQPDGRYADAPHEYNRRSKAPDLDEYHGLVRYIQQKGVNRGWRGHMFRYLDLSDGNSYWGWAAVINRMKKRQTPSLMSGQSRLPGWNGMLRRMGARWRLNCNQDVARKGRGPVAMTAWDGGRARRVHHSAIVKLGPSRAADL